MGALGGFSRPKSRSPEPEPLPPPQKTKKTDLQRYVDKNVDIDIDRNHLIRHKQITKLINNKNRKPLGTRKSEAFNPPGNHQTADPAPQHPL